MSTTRPGALERPQLRRSLSAFGLFALAFGSMIGVGWVTALGSWLTNAGPGGAILAFLAGGAVILCIGLCYAEITPMLPLAGGEVAYAYKAFGTGKAFIVGWFLAFGYISVSAFEAISIGRVLGYMFPALARWELYRVAGEPVYLPHLLLAVLFTALITGINYIGVARAGAFQKWLTLGFIAVTVVFVAAGLILGDPGSTGPLFVGDSVSASLGGALAVFVTVPFWFVGFDTIPQGAEEADAAVPPRRLGTLILISIVAATAFYAILILSVAATGPWQSIVDADLPTARAFQFAFGSPVLVNLVLVAAVIGLLTSWNGFFLAASRVLFALGRGRIISERFGNTHARFLTPGRAILFVGAVTLVAPLLGRSALIAFVDVGSFCIGIAFLGVALSVIRLRKIWPDAARPYTIPGGLVIPYTAVAGALFVLAVMLVPGSPAALVWPLEALILAGCSMLGLFFWFAGRRGRGTIDEGERAWLILEDYAAEAPRFTKEEVTP